MNSNTTAGQVLPSSVLLKSSPEEGRTSNVLEHLSAESSLLLLLMFVWPLLTAQLLRLLCVQILLPLSALRKPGWTITLVATVISLVTLSCCGGFWVLLRSYFVSTCYQVSTRLVNAWCVGVLAYSVVVTVGVVILIIAFVNDLVTAMQLAVVESAERRKQMNLEKLETSEISHKVEGLWRECLACTIQSMRIGKALSTQEMSMVYLTPYQTSTQCRKTNCQYCQIRNKSQLNPEVMLISIELAAAVAMVTVHIMFAVVLSIMIIASIFLFLLTYKDSNCARVFLVVLVTVPFIAVSLTHVPVVSGSLFTTNDLAKLQTEPLCIRAYEAGFLQCTNGIKMTLLKSDFGRDANENFTFYTDDGNYTVKGDEREFFMSQVGDCPDDHVYSPYFKSCVDKEVAGFDGYQTISVLQYLECLTGFTIGPRILKCPPGDGYFFSDNECRELEDRTCFENQHFSNQPERITGGIPIVRNTTGNSTMARSTPIETGVQSRTSRTTDLVDMGVKKCDVERVIDGTDVPNNELTLPFYYYGNGHCSANILTKRTMLIAAHCVVGDIGGYKVYYKGRYIGVDGITIRDGYDPATLFNDQAILTMSMPFDEEFCGERVDPKIGEEVIVFGWGTSQWSVNEFGTFRMSKVLKVIPPPAGSLPGHFYTFHNTSDACQGDSGAYVWLYDDEAKNTGVFTKLVGLVSHGVQCGNGKDPGVMQMIELGEELALSRTANARFEEVYTQNVIGYAVFEGRTSGSTFKLVEPNHSWYYTARGSITYSGYYGNKYIRSQYQSEQKKRLVVGISSGHYYYYGGAGGSNVKSYYKITDNIPKSKEFLKGYGVFRIDDPGKAPYNSTLFYTEAGYVYIDSKYRGLLPYLSTGKSGTLMWTPVFSTYTNTSVKYDIISFRPKTKTNNKVDSWRLAGKGTSAMYVDSFEMAVSTTVKSTVENIHFGYTPDRYVPFTQNPHFPILAGIPGMNAYLYIADCSRDMLTVGKVKVNGVWKAVQMVAYDSFLRYQCGAESVLQELRYEYVTIIYKLGNKINSVTLPEFTQSLTPVLSQRIIATKGKDHSSKMGRSTSTYYSDGKFERQTRLLASAYRSVPGVVDYLVNNRIWATVYCYMYVFNMIALLLIYWYTNSVHQSEIKDAFIAYARADHTEKPAKLRYATQLVHHERSTAPQLHWENTTNQEKNETEKRISNSLSTDQDMLDEVVATSNKAMKSMHDASDVLKHHMQSMMHTKHSGITGGYQIGLTILICLILGLSLVTCVNIYRPIEPVRERGTNEIKQNFGHMMYEHGLTYKMGDSVNHPNPYTRLDFVPTRAVPIYVTATEMTDGCTISHENFIPPGMMYGETVKVIVLCGDKLSSVFYIKFEGEIHHVKGAYKYTTGAIFPLQLFSVTNDIGRALATKFELLAEYGHKDIDNWVFKELRTQWRRTYGAYTFRPTFEKEVYFFEGSDETIYPVYTILDDATDVMTVKTIENIPYMTSDSMEIKTSFYGVHTVGYDSEMISVEEYPKLTAVPRTYGNFPDVVYGQRDDSDIGVSDFKISAISIFPDVYLKDKDIPSTCLNLTSTYTCYMLDNRFMEYTGAVREFCRVKPKLSGVYHVPAGINLGQNLVVSQRFTNTPGEKPEFSISYAKYRSESTKVALSGNIPTHSIGEAVTNIMIASCQYSALRESTFIIVRFSVRMGDIGLIHVRGDNYTTDVTDTFLVSTDSSVKTVFFTALSAWGKFYFEFYSDHQPLVVMSSVCTETKTDVVKGSRSFLSRSTVEEDMHIQTATPLNSKSYYIIYIVGFLINVMFLLYIPYWCYTFNRVKRYAILRPFAGIGSKHD